MPNASRDANRVPTVLGTLDTDGSTLVLGSANPVTHRLRIENGNTGTDFGPVNAKRDENRVTALTCVSKDDGVTPVSVYLTSDGRIKVDGIPN